MTAFGEAMYAGLNTFQLNICMSYNKLMPSLERIEARGIVHYTMSVINTESMNMNRWKRLEDIWLSLKINSGDSFSRCSLIY